jgi:hypothetical protein
MERARALLKTISDRALATALEVLLVAGVTSGLTFVGVAVRSGAMWPWMAASGCGGFVGGVLVMGFANRRRERPVMRSEVIVDNLPWPFQFEELPDKEDAAASVSLLGDLPRCPFCGTELIEYQNLLAQAGLDTYPTLRCPTCRNKGIGLRVASNVDDAREAALRMAQRQVRRSHG